VNDTRIPAVLLGEFLRPKAVLSIDHQKLGFVGNDDAIIRPRKLLDVGRQGYGIREGSLTIKYRAGNLARAILLDNALETLHRVL
jgi:hypothetical protein